MIVRLLLVTSLQQVVSGSECGKPGEPANGSLMSTEILFYPGEEVRKFLKYHRNSWVLDNNIDISLIPGQLQLSRGLHADRQWEEELQWWWSVVRSVASVQREPGAAQTHHSVRCALELWSWPGSGRWPQHMQLHISRPGSEVVAGSNSPRLLNSVRWSWMHDESSGVVNLLLD